MTLPFPPLGLFPPPDATSPPSTSPTPVVTPSSTATPLPSSASTGFPLASLCGGRSKAQRWCEDGEAGSSPVVALVLGGDRQSYKEALVSSWSLDGDWVKVEGRRARRLARRPSNPTLRPAFVDLCGRRFNCFSPDHQVAECRSRVRCFLCRLPRHRVYMCSHRRTVLPIPKCTLVWQSVSKEISVVAGSKRAMEGDSVVGGFIAGEGAKRYTRRGQQRRRAKAGGGLGDHIRLSVDRRRCRRWFLLLLRWTLLASEIHWALWEG